MSVFKKKAKEPLQPQMLISQQELFNIIATTFRHREGKMVEAAARHAASVAIAELMAHLEHVGVLDANGQAKPVILRMRPECYPPLVLQ